MTSFWLALKYALPQLSVSPKYKTLWYWLDVPLLAPAVIFSEELYRSTVNSLLPFQKFSGRTRSMLSSPSKAMPLPFTVGLPDLTVAVMLPTFEAHAETAPFSAVTPSEASIHRARPSVVISGLTTEVAVTVTSALA